MTLVIRDVHDVTALLGRVFSAIDVLNDALDLSQNRIQRVLQRAVEAVALRRTQLRKVRLDLLAGVRFRAAVFSAQVLRDFIAREHGSSDLVGSHVACMIAAYVRSLSARATASSSARSSAPNAEALSLSMS